MYCSKCGAYNEDGADVCQNCGQPLTSVHGGRRSSSGSSSGPSSRGSSSGSSGEPSPGSSSSDSSPSGSDFPSAEVAGLLIRVVCLVPGVLFACNAVLNVGDILTGISSVFSGYFLYAAFRTVSKVLYALSYAFLAAGLLIMGLRYHPRKEHAERLLLTVGLGGVLRILLEAAGRICHVIAASFHPWLSGGFAPLSFLRVIVYTAAILVILYVLLTIAGIRPYQDLPAGGILGMVRELPDFLAAELDELSREAERRRSGGEYAGPAPEAGPRTASEAYSAKPRMKEDRSVLLYYLVGICTCGIYQLYVIHTFSRDINTICRGDGAEDTPGIGKYILFSIITCGIYSYVWHYRMISRIENASGNYGSEIRTFGGMRFGTFWVVCSVLGLLLAFFGVGLVLQIYAEYLLFWNLNELSRAYNALMS